MKRKVAVVVSLLTLIISANLYLMNGNAAKTVAAVSEIQPYANQTGYKYKEINGRLYKRLWSYTYNRWEEPNWTLS